MVTVVDRDQFERALEVAGLTNASVREDYSGRGMYGSECLAIVADLGDLLTFAAALGSDADEWDWVGDDVRSDSMGRATIWYWPGVRLEEAS